MKRVSSGSIPYRINPDLSVQVLLVRSTGGTRWVFPKGGVEPNLSRRENAVKEAAEEAGVVGELGSKVGQYTFTKADVEQHVTMFLMHVVLELEHYPESQIRARQWATIEEAKTLLDPDMHWLLQRVETIQKTLTQKVTK